MNAQLIDMSVLGGDFLFIRDQLYATEFCAVVSFISNFHFCPISLFMRMGSCSVGISF